MGRGEMHLDLHFWGVHDEILVLGSSAREVGSLLRNDGDILCVLGFYFNFFLWLSALRELTPPGWGWSQ